MNRFLPAAKAAMPAGLIAALLILFAVATPTPIVAIPEQPPVSDELPPYRSNVSQYAIDRGNDLLDIVRLRVGIPHKAHAFGAKARVTCLAQLGFVWFEGEQYGLDRRAVGQFHEGRTEGGISLLYFSNVQTEPGWGNRFLRGDDPWSSFQTRGIVRNNLYWDDGRRHPLSIGAELQTGILPGLDVGVYPGEALDFVMGFLTIDFWDDDGLHANRNLRRLAKLRQAARGEAQNGELAIDAKTALSPETAMEQDFAPIAPYSDEMLPPVIELEQTQPIFLAPGQTQLAPMMEMEPAAPVEQGAAPEMPEVVVEGASAAPPVPRAAPAPKERLATLGEEIKRTQLQELAKLEVEEQLEEAAPTQRETGESAEPAPIIPAPDIDDEKEGVKGEDESAPLLMDDDEGAIENPQSDEEAGEDKASDDEDSEQDQ